MQSQFLRGEQALAYGAWAAGVGVVTAYPGSPSSGVVEYLLAISAPDEVHIQWSANEKVALETALGASLAGQRALVCMKSVGFNIALDLVMTANLTGVHGGLVILVGDDPGAWASQNEQDSRYLAAFAELPLLEPAWPAEAAAIMCAAFHLSEEMQLPVVVRETRGFSWEGGMVPPLWRTLSRRAAFDSQGLRWVSLPFNVVANHRRLHERLRQVATRFQHCPFNATEGRGSLGIVAAGFAQAKLKQALPQGMPVGVSVLKLSTLYPLPDELLVAFLSDKERILVLEETEPFLEDRLRSLAQRRGLALDIQGKETGHLPREGALTVEHTRHALAGLRGESVSEPVGGVRGEAARPSQQGLCEGCFYTPLFQALQDELAALEVRGVICADPGCAIRIYQPPFEMLEVKQSMGSAIGLASGLWLAGVDRLPIALVGDSSFFHTGLSGLLSAVAAGASILVMILDNGSAAMTGGQPHPGSGRDARGTRAPAVQLEGLLNACCVDHLATVDPTERLATRQAVREALRAEGLRVIIARGECSEAGQS